MNTASITHHRIPVATAAAAVVAAIAFTAVAGSHESDTRAPAPGSQQSSVVQGVHGHHFPAEHGGTVMIGQP